MKDLARARRALSLGPVFYPQQAAEKRAKALLETRRRVVRNHGPELISELYDAFREELVGTSALLWRPWGS